DSHMRAVFIYSVADGKAFQLTDGMSDAISPAFDASGKYLYFLASTDYGPRSGWLEMSSLDRPVRRAIYITVLSSTEPSPLLPEPGDEPHKDDSTPRAKPEAPSGPVVVRVDPAGIGQRILALKIPPGEYSDIRAGSAGVIYYTEPMIPGNPFALR